MIDNMKTVYIKFEAPKDEIKKSKTVLLDKIFDILFSPFIMLLSIISKIIPNSNPDFDGKIDDVRWWLVELDNETGIPQREVGLNKEGQVIMKMPFGDNYGYWTDNNLLLNDFKKSFVVHEVDKGDFDESWNKNLLEFGEVDL